MRYWRRSASGWIRPAGDVGIEGDRQRVERDVRDRLGELLRGGGHQLGVEGAGHRQLLGLVAHLGKRVGGGLGGGVFTRDDRLGGVVVVDGQDVAGGLLADAGDRPLVAAEDRVHAAGVLGRRRAASRFPRAAIIRKPSSSEKAPAAVSAAYSPSEWPATAEGSHIWETTE